MLGVLLSDSRMVRGDLLFLSTDISKLQVNGQRKRNRMLHIRKRKKKEFDCIKNISNTDNNNTPKMSNCSRTHFLLVTIRKISTRFGRNKAVQVLWECHQFCSVKGANKTNLQGAFRFWLDCRLQAFCEVFVKVEIDFPSNQEI